MQGLQDADILKLLSEQRTEHVRPADWLSP